MLEKVKFQGWLISAYFLNYDFKKFGVYVLHPVDTVKIEM